MMSLMTFSCPRGVKKSAAALLLAVSLIACNPHSAMARQSDEDIEHYDARVQGYDNPDVELKSSSTGMAWMLVICLGVMCVAVIFKDAKRSHLD